MSQKVKLLPVATKDPKICIGVMLIIMPKRQREKTVYQQSLKFHLLNANLWSSFRTLRVKASRITSTFDLRVPGGEAAVCYLANCGDQ